MKKNYVLTETTEEEMYIEPIRQQKARTLYLKRAQQTNFVGEQAKSGTAGY